MNSSYCPIIKRVKWLGVNRVRLTFSRDRVRDAELPIASAKKAHRVSEGLGLDIGDGREYSARYLYAHSSRTADLE
jgi:hypothetical protein